jgi:hypothetical protein
MTFTASSNSTLLSFLGTAGVQYIGLDNVSVDDLGGPTVPEPATILLLGSGLLLMGRMRRRKAGWWPKAGN